MMHAWQTEVATRGIHVPISRREPEYQRRLVWAFDDWGWLLEIAAGAAVMSSWAYVLIHLIWDPLMLSGFPFLY